MDRIWGAKDLLRDAVEQTTTLVAETHAATAAKAFRPLEANAITARPARRALCRRAAGSRPAQLNHLPIKLDRFCRAACPAKTRRLGQTGGAQSSGKLWLAEH